MKLVDDKGKLFGLVNLLDLFVVAFILVLVIAIGTKLVKNPESYAVNQGNNVKDMYVTVKCTAVTDELINNIKKGDKLLAQNAYTGGEIFSVGEILPSEYTGVNSDGQVIVSEHPYLKDVYVTLVTDQNIDTPVLKANGQEVRIGNRMFLKTQTVEVSSIVMDIEFQDKGSTESETPVSSN